MRLQEAVEPESGQQPVLVSKLRPPRLNHVLLRPRLLSRANPVNKLKLVNICAGPGFGKTTLMAQIAQAFEGNSVWYQVDNLDRDPAVFLRHLIAGIAHAGGFDSTRARSCMNETTDFIREGESIIAVFIDELSEQSGRPLLICFDDFHLFDEMEHAPRLVEYLIQNLPENVLVAIASRSVPKLSLGRLRSHGSLCDLGERELQFNLDELKELVDKWEIKTTADAVEQLHKSTEGWAAGLVLTENYLRSGNQAPDLFSQRQLQQNVYEYLAEEVLNKQPPEIQDFLMKAALIDPIDPSICRMALDMDDATRILEQAERHNLFTARLDDAAFYRYHPLFREFLISRLELQAGEDRTNTLRVKFAEAFISTGKERLAVEQYLLASRPQEATTLIERLGDQMLNDAEYETLEFWLKTLGEESIPPTIKIFKALVLMSSGKFRKALNILEKVQSSVNPENLQLYCKSKIAMATCLGELGQGKDGIEILKPLLKLSLSPLLRSEIIDRLFFCCWLNDGKEGIQTYTELATKIECDEVPPFFRGLKFVFSMKSLWEGDFLAAEEILTMKFEDEGLSENQKNIRMNNLASCLMMMGKYSIAWEMAEKCKKRVEKQRETRLLPIVLDTLGCLLIAKGDHSSGETLLKNALEESSGIEHNRNDLSTSTFCHLGTLARRQGNLSLAYDYHLKSDAFAGSLNEYYVHAMSTVNLAANLVRMTNYDEAESYFKKAEKIANKCNFRYVLTHVDFHRAWAAYKNGDKKAELRNISSALKRARKFQHNHFIIQEGKISLPLFTIALEHGLEVDYVFWILEQIGEKSLCVVEPLLTHDDDSIRQKIAALLAVIGSANAITLLSRMRNDRNDQVQNFVKQSLVEARHNLRSPSELLTSREMEVLKWLSNGSSNCRIAEKLFISERTVKTHVAKIFRKLGFTSRLDAALYYRQLEEKNTTFQD